MGAIPFDRKGNEARVLLGKRGIEPCAGDWNVIGGFLRYGEDPFEGLKREVFEELGVKCEIEQFIAQVCDTYGPAGPATINIYFTVQLLSPDIRPQDDVVELKWFSLDSLPENMAFKCDTRALNTLLAKRNQTALKYIDNLPGS